MIIYPLIELQNGRCVSLYRGRLDQPDIWHVDPVAKAREFAEAGAEWLHVTDFDGVLGGNTNNALLQEIIRSAGIPVQLGGGFRAQAQVEEWIDKGAGRIVIGTLALQQPDLVKSLARSYPDQIVVALDVYKGQVVSEGWRDTSALVPADVVRTYDGTPLAAIIVTDIDADLEEAEDSLALITQVASETRTPVIARGVARSLDDLSRVKYVPHVSGAILGRALFDKTIDLSDALALAQPEREEKADFV